MGRRWIAAAVLVAGCSSGTGDATPTELAAWMCSQLERGISEEEMTPKLAAEARDQGVNLRETLREVEDQCPEQLSG